MFLIMQTSAVLVHVTENKDTILTDGCDMQEVNLQSMTATQCSTYKLSEADP